MLFFFAIKLIVYYIIDYSYLNIPDYTTGKDRWLILEFFFLRNHLSGIHLMNYCITRIDHTQKMKKTNSESEKPKKNALKSGNRHELE